MTDTLTPPQAPHEARKAAYLKCKHLLYERESLPWWAWRRFNAINREIRALLANLDDAL